MRCWLSGGMGLGGRWMRRLALTGATVVLVALVAVPAAAASVRFAAPGASGPQPCVQADPCSLVRAATGSGVQDGDRVVVEPGSYPLTSGLSIAKAIDIGGKAGHPLPTLTGSADSLFFVSNSSAYAHDLRIVSSGTNAALLMFGGTAERIYAESTYTGAPGGAYACASFDGALLRDSVCWGRGTGSDGYLDTSSGVQSQTATLRNVTAIASAPGTVGLGVESTGGAAQVVDAVNVIARGTLDDVQATTDSSSGAGATINFTNSNYATVNTTGTGASITTAGTSGNQTPAPVFANAGSGDFHERAASPTIGAGVTDPANGTLDLGGNPRTENGKTDIGAYELAFTLAVAKSGSGTGKVTSVPAGISCGGSCSHSYAPGTIVTLTATRARGSKFAGWSAGSCAGTGTCKVKMSANQTVGAKFVLLPPDTAITNSTINQTHHQAGFSFKAIGKATGFQCALVKATKAGQKQPKPSYSACSSPKTYKHLKPSSYTFFVRAFNAGGADPTPAKKSFTIP